MIRKAVVIICTGFFACACLCWADFTTAQELRLCASDSVNQLRESDYDGWFAATKDKSGAYRIDLPVRPSFGHNAVQIGDVLRLANSKRVPKYYRVQQKRGIVLEELSSVKGFPELPSKPLGTNVGKSSVTIVWLGGFSVLHNVILSASDTQKGVRLSFRPNQSASDFVGNKGSTIVTEGDIVALHNYKLKVDRIVPSNRRLKLGGWIELSKN